jgi:hypothetical protein
MSSALGEEGRLLALKCQPAEVQGMVPIPDNMQFWGVDSGACRLPYMPAGVHAYVDISNTCMIGVDASTQQYKILSRKLASLHPHPFDLVPCAISRMQASGTAWVVLTMELCE